MNAKEQEMLAAVNAARSGYGLQPLREDPRLSIAARAHAEDMAAHSGMVHIGSDGSDGERRMLAAGYSPRQWLEAVGWGWGGDVFQQVEWWLGSSAHRHIILASGLPDVGIGYATGGEWGHYWTLDLGRTDVPYAPPPENAPQPPPNASQGHSTVNIPIVMGGGPTGVGGVTYDLLPYLRGDGRLYEVRHASGATETFQTQTEGDAFYTVKNSQWEQLRADGEFIWRGLDTSPGEGRFYRQWEDGRDMARWCPRYGRVGQSWTGPGHNVQFYDKATCTPDPRNSGRATNRMLFVAHHRSAVWNGVQVEDVVELQGAGGERYFMARNLGMVAWSSPWGSSAIVQVYAPGERPNLTREVIRCL